MKYYAILFLVFNSWYFIDCSEQQKKNPFKLQTVKPPKAATWDADRIVKKMCSIYNKEAYTYYLSPPKLITDNKSVKKVVNCQTVEPLVVKGREAHPKEFPHMAAIGYGEQGSVEWLCSGSLISDRFVLSAAHCVVTHGTKKTTLIKLGDLDLHNSTDDEQAFTFSIAKIFVHPEYNPPHTLYHDIALFKLSADVIFSAYIRPICLSTSSYKELKTGELGLIISGFGFEIEGGKNGRLRSGKISMISDDECARRYNSENGYSDGFNSSVSICAGDDSETENATDACQGDSGGPLQIQDGDKLSCIYIQIGITSYGLEECTPRIAAIPAVYTNIQYYIKWIQEKVWPINSVDPLNSNNQARS